MKPSPETCIDQLRNRDDDEMAVALETDPARWPLDGRELYPRERRLWYEQLWTDVCALRERYRLPLRSGWWANDIQIEALAALAAWVERDDSGEWDDPPAPTMRRVSRTPIVVPL